MDNSDADSEHTIDFSAFEDNSLGPRPGLGLNQELEMASQTQAESRALSKSTTKEQQNYGTI